MPTLEELFHNKELPSQGGKTAKDAYAIRNSKDIRISAADPFVNTVGMSLARLARKNLGVRGSETLLEEEVTGARLIRTASMPFIYGSDLPRLTLRTTEALSLMKTATSGELSDGGLIGGKIAKAVSTVKSTLGIPILASPTYVVNELNDTSKYKVKHVSDRMIDLAKIKDDAAGTLLGKFLKGLGGGNLKTLGKQALGAGLKLGKQELRKKLFGGGDRKGLKVTGTVFVDNSVVGFTEDSAMWFGTRNINYGANLDGQPNSDPTTIEVDMNDTPYSKTVQPKADDLKDRNDLSLKQQLDYEPLNEWRTQGGDISPIQFSKTPDRIPKFSSEIKRKTSENDFIEKKRGMRPTSDIINSTNIFEGETLTLGDGTTLDEKDFVPLKFTSLHRGKTAQFRGTITGLSETLSPSWESHKFIGSPFSNYTYSGIERSVTFNFKAYALNAAEQKIVWDKINFLSSLVFPQGYYESSAVVPPFIKFTLGDLYQNKLSFIESLSHTWDDTTPWNVMDEEQIVKLSSAGTFESIEDVAPNMKGYRLPMITDVNVTIKFLENKNTSSSRKFYSFNPQTS